ncbi:MULTISPECIES: flavin reductase [Selenomonas]|jgi:flavin reductase (DIM6/NTAB) family NADH-FMN oxidoreductase RutF|uniref:NADH-FMN oxidoreductase RutF, flavin reductase (DIM6/NTAB) family n=1 Tax=Selenomonas ruminantium TaxID=971 RepID=A0A1I0WMF0_SELRU|nr:MULTISPECIES: flavin reductase [Selenomonas]SFA89557.1 NADH-FMN oxidoreductase RutF, flavin reductase (DIM6/NTAB) family [Selenomonas ruminantium]
MNPKAMFNISYGLYVLTANLDGKDNGCIINTVTQVTSDPNQISIAVNKLNHTRDMIAASKKFTASIISQNADFELFKRFGFQSGKNVDKFAGFTAAQRGANEAMIINEGTNAYIAGWVTQEIDLGTHSLFIARVTDMDVLNDTPAATYAYYHQNIKPKPQAPAPSKSGKTIWRCKICGYEYEGDELPADFICPLCKHPASDFERVN